MDAEKKESQKTVLETMGRLGSIPKTSNLIKYKKITNHIREYNSKVPNKLPILKLRNDNPNIEIKRQSGIKKSGNTSFK